MTMIKKLLMIIACVSICSTSHAQNKIAELSDYFYPFMEFEYTVTPKIKNPITKASYRISRQGNVLIKKVYTMQGMYSRPLSETSYLLEFDKENNAILSKKQITVNALTKVQQTSTDQIVLFIIPEEGSSSAWEETINGEKYNCRAQYAYLKCGEVVKKVIRIKKECKVNNKIVTECEYWSKTHSRIATYGKWGDGEITLTEISDMVDPPYDFEEITEDEYSHITVLSHFKKTLSENAIELYSGNPEFEMIKQKLDESIKSDYTNEYLTKEISVKIEIATDKSVRVDVSSDSEKAKTIIQRKAKTIIDELIAGNQFHLETVVEPVTKTECCKPIKANFNYVFTQKRMSVSLVYKKGEWQNQTKEQIPDDIWNDAVKTASRKLQEDPKAKKQTFSVFYIESPLGRFLY